MIAILIVISKALAAWARSVERRLMKNATNVARIDKVFEEINE